MSSSPEGPPLWRHLLAVCALPFTATVAVPVVLMLTAGFGPGWGLRGAPAALFVAAGVVLALLGLRLAYETISLFRSAGEGTLAPWDPTRRLVVRGPYLRVRNPMITGVGLVLLGEGVALGSTAILIEFGLFALANALWMPLVEEPGLERRFGDEYLEYKRIVPRWIPRAAEISPPGRPPRPDRRRSRSR